MGNMGLKMRNRIKDNITTTYEDNGLVNAIEIKSEFHIQRKTGISKELADQNVELLDECIDFNEKQLLSEIKYDMFYDIIEQFSKEFYNILNGEELYLDGYPVNNSAVNSVKRTMIDLMYSIGFSPSLLTRIMTVMNMV